MQTVNRGLSATTAPDYSISDILKMTEAPKQSSGFRRVLGSVVGGVGNLVMPGIGSAIGNLISGNQLNSSGLLGESTQFLELQRQMQMESRAFETASTVLKCRHDSAMAAVRNMKQ